MEMNMQFLGKLPIPMEIKAQYPLTQEAAEIKKEREQKLPPYLKNKGDFL